jgi:hypothetical protein
MENCISKIEEIYIKNPIFDSIANCTYIVLCCGENPKRLSSVMKNINILNPTTKVKLIYNKGYKNCECSKSVNHDLANIQNYIFEDAISNNYKRILFLEDDFELPEKIDKDDIININNFIKNHNPDVYGLGNFSIPEITSIFSAHEKVLCNFLGLTHAVFYNKNSMKKICKYYKNHKNPITLGIDSSISEIDNIEVYRYYRPLVYQKLPATENQKNGWKNQIGTILATISIGFINLTKLHSKLEPGYSILYVLPYILYLIFILLFIILIRYIYKKCKN